MNARAGKRSGGAKQVLKIALRSSLRNLRQTVLTILIIAIPFSAATAGFTINESSIPTNSERIEIELGGAEAKLSTQRFVDIESTQNSSDQFLYQRPDSEELLGGPSHSNSSGEASLQDPRFLDIANGTWVSSFESKMNFKTASGIGSLLLIEGEVWKLDSKYELLQGRPPTTNEEVALSPAALDRMAASLGSTVQMESGKELRVVGVLDPLNLTDSVSVVFSAPGSLTGIVTEQNLLETDFYLLSDSSVSWNQVLEFNRYGIGVLSAEVLKNPPTSEQLPAPLRTLMPGNQELLFSLISVISIFTVMALPIAILSGAAFAFGARRQERTLAVMASIGASPSQLKRVTTFSGLTLGFFGGVLGIAAGLGFAAIYMPIQAQGSKALYPGFHLPILELSLLLVLSIFTAYVVSLLPAREAAKVDVIATLRGRGQNLPLSQKAKTGSLFLILSGLLLIIATSIGWDLISSNTEAGLFLSIATWIIAQGPLVGSLLMIVGLLVGSGWLIQLLRFITKQSGAATRFAARDMMFNRKRYQPVIASVLAISFLGSSVLVFVFANLYNEQSRYKPAIPANQILFDPRPGMPEVMDPMASRGQDKDYFENALERESERLEQKLSIVQNSVESVNASIIGIHTPLSGLGFGMDPSTFSPIIGAEGEQPVVQIDPHSYCPWNTKHPDYSQYAEIEAQSWEKAMEFMTDPDFDECGMFAYYRENIFIGNEEDLEKLLGQQPSADAVEVLQAGGAVASKPDFYLDGKVVMEWYPSSSLNLLNGYSESYLEDGEEQAEVPEPSKSIELSATLSETPYRKATVMISPETAFNLGIESDLGILVANFPDGISQDQEDYLAAELGGFLIEKGFYADPDEVAWIIFATAAALILLSTLIAISLVQIESRPDFSTLAAVGAKRSYRARIVGLQAFFLTGLGTLFGTLVGVIFARQSMSLIFQYQLEYPWLQLGALVILLPAIIGLIAFVLTPKSLPFANRNALD